MTQTTTSTISLMGRRAESFLAQAGTPGIWERNRKGAHLLIEPKATISPRGRENSRVRANSSAVVPRPSSNAL